MTERHLTILQINDLHGYLEPHPEAFRVRGKTTSPKRRVTAATSGVRQRTDESLTDL